MSRTEIKAFVKYKGKTKVEEFYCKYVYGKKRIRRGFLQKIIDGHMVTLNNEFHTAKWTKRKKPVFYRFEIRKFSNEKLILYSNRAYIEKGLEWNLLSSKTKTFKDE